MRFLSLIVLLLAFVLESRASATVSINLSGSAENSTVSLEKADTHSVSANIGLSLGQHFMIGLTHRRAFTKKSGLKKVYLQGTLQYPEFREREQTITNSVDLTIIPFNGVVSPFIFGGVARRDYYSESEIYNTRNSATLVLFPIPNYGGGLAIQLGMGFELRITQTFTPGKETQLMENGEEKSRDVVDTYTQLWLGYKLR